MTKRGGQISRDKRERFSRFVFDGYEIDRPGSAVYLSYRFDEELRFTEKLVFESPVPDWNRVDPEVLHSAVSALHIAGGVSYYKAFCPHAVAIEAEPLAPEKAAFWNTFYRKGLGEFCYENSIDSDTLPAFPQEGDAPSNSPCRISLAPRALVPIGGGKDSLLTIEILKRGSIPFTLISVNDAPPIRDTALRSGVERIIVRRFLDPKLEILNREGALNGHVPITGYLSFVFVAAALLYDFRYIAMSLEKSADFSQLVSGSIAVNHQWSKSAEFEGLFRSYLNRFVTPGIEYFSLLRPFYELKIGELFARFEAAAVGGLGYLDICSSCNRNFRQGGSELSSRWCVSCPKCAFVFAALSPFVEPQRLITAFGKNIFEDPQMLDTYRSLLGLTNSLPFECVGTASETRLALSLASDIEEYRESPVLKMFKAEAPVSPEERRALEDRLLGSCESETIPEPFRLMLRDV